MIHKVYIREKTMRSGRTYLYLQFYPAIKNKITGKSVEWESLHLEVFPGTRDKEKRQQDKFNRDVAYQIYMKRAMQIAAEDYDFADPFRRESDALAYFKELAEYKNKINCKWNVVYGYFEKFTKGSCKFGEIDVFLVEKFRDYLLTTTDTRLGVRLNRNAASAYFGLFKTMLRCAYKRHLLTENLSDQVDGIKTLKTHKEFLTIEEVKALSLTYCEIDVLKRAALFSCFTGLRISDVMNLKWENIIKNQFGGYSIELNTVKNGKLCENPLSPEALEFCGERGVGLVFPGLERSMLYKEMPEWIRDAGIDKHITFHCFRHTYATLQIAAGTDIYTVSKMLTHSNVATTQIYAELVNEKKMETISRISLKDVNTTL
ncbi:MAG: site-specific integrase [Bacteroidales bacterium]|nr:site-specific integrase [Candidatus Egerieousia equi]